MIEATVTKRDKSHSDFVVIYDRSQCVYVGEKSSWLWDYVGQKYGAYVAM